MSTERYITFDVSGIQDDGGSDVVAFHESERWQAYLDLGEWNEYVWQYADSHEQAIQQHDDKFVEWRDDVNSGRPEKDTY